MRYFIYYSLFLSILFNTQSAQAVITIDSVSTAISTCSNNGSAIVYATSTIGGGLFYAIVSGPVLSAIQNSNVFASLYPGSYTARVYDVNFDSLDTQFNIGGNYQLPDFDLEIINPTCVGFFDGSITAVIDSTAGLAPYTFQMIAPVIGPVISQNYFQNLDANTYQVRMTDVCGSYQTRSATLINTGTGLLPDNFQLYPYFNKIGCDTFLTTTTIWLEKGKGSFPITLSYNTSSGTISKQVFPMALDTINYLMDLYNIIDTLANVTYGDYCQMVLTDVCSESVYSVYSTIAPFDWEVGFSGTSVNCVTTLSGTAKIKQLPYYPYHNIVPAANVSFTLVDLSTGLMADSGTCGQCEPYLVPETSGNSYLLTITDGCGDMWQQTIVWPSPGAPLVNVYQIIGCRDSTIGLQFEPKGFQTLTTLTFTSGPVYGQSTKPGFAHADSITYPKVFHQVLPCCIVVKDCPVGTYFFEVTDSCGNSIQGSLTIDSSMVSHFDYEWYIKASCLNDNTLYYNFNKETPAAIYAQISGVGNNYYTSFYPGSSLDSIVNLNVGTYAVEIDYLQYNGGGAYFDGSMFDSTPDCWVIYDTIVIAPYTNSTFLTNNTIYCNGINYVELIPDSSRGVPPYQFSIISGPQTFPLQDSAIFQIQQFGNYVVSMEDVCGNNFTQQITVSSDSFPPIIKVGFFCEGNYATLSGVSSTHFSYVWQTPSGSLITGDSLVFNPFMVSDTGWYHVFKIININGCNDTLQTDYYIPATDSILQNISVCQGDSVVVGSSVYYLPGVYYDTLATATGCDSLVITTLAFSPLPVDTVATAICNGDSLLVGIHQYTVPGVYTDTVPDGVICKKIIVTQLSVITITNTINATICPGDYIHIGNYIHSEAGIFHDTLTAASGCDSIVIITLNLFQPVAYNIVTLTDTAGSGIVFPLTCNNQQAIQYYWYGMAQFSNRDSLYTTAILDSSQWIYLEVTDSNGCKITDSVFIYVSEEIDTCSYTRSLIMPNVFTPNQDGANDFFEVHAEYTEVEEFLVYDRWGKLVYKTAQSNVKWDGRNSNNNSCVEGVYYYILRYKSCNDFKIKYFKGMVTLMR